MRWERAAIAALVVALVAVVHPLLRSETLQQAYVDDWAQRFGRYFGTPLVLIGDSQTGLNHRWGWDLYGNPLRAVVLAEYGGTVHQVAGGTDTAIGLRPRTIVIMGGTNDVELDLAPDVTVREYRALVARLLPTHARIIVTLAPPSRDRQHSIAMAALNARLRANLAGLPVTILDLPELRDADGRVDPRFVGRDGLHLNRAGYRIWEDRLRPLLRSAS